MCRHKNERTKEKKERNKREESGGRRVEISEGEEGEMREIEVCMRKECSSL